MIIDMKIVDSKIFVPQLHGYYMGTITILGEQESEFEIEMKKAIRKQEEEDNQKLVEQALNRSSICGLW